MIKQNIQTILGKCVIHVYFIGPVQEMTENVIGERFQCEDVELPLLQEGLGVRPTESEGHSRSLPSHRKSPADSG